MPPKKIGGKRKRSGGAKMPSARSKMVMQGDGFFGDLWKGIKRGFKFAKDNKLISKGLSLIPHAGAQGASKIASAVGLGKRRRVTRRKPQAGGAMAGRLYIV